MATPSRDDLAEMYLGQLPYPPYPVQEEALLAWFTHPGGVLVCAPTGTGKTLIAHAALFEALHTGTTAYYTTPLIALTEQKFHEMQHLAVQWGFRAEDVGLVTGNRRVNPDARVLVVVAEILLNRLLHPAAFNFHGVSAVVMDEFHNFGDIERGIVWELALALLPPNVRLLLLSATVGNSAEFINWLDVCHGRKVQLVEGKERKVPLTYNWVPDMLLGELLVDMAQGEDANRKTPALVFCFNRDECWSVAEQLKGLDLTNGPQRTRLIAAVDAIEWKDGIGPKMKQLLRRGVGIHHAGLLPKYRRTVEDFFVKKLLSVAVCTETLAAGINLPARSVVLTSLLKGPHGKMKVIDASIAHQIFGRAGRPQFDDRGYVYALAHEDDVKILRWKEKYDQIPEHTKDPTLLRAKKDLKRKKPSRRETEQYWGQGDFDRLKAAPPGKLYSKGPLPWRLLAYLLKVSPDVAKVRTVVHKRLMDESRLRAGEKALDRMLVTLHQEGFVVLDPPPPVNPTPPAPLPEAERGEIKQATFGGAAPRSPSDLPPSPLGGGGAGGGGVAAPYVPLTATPTPELDKLLVFRSIHPLYGTFLLKHLGIANHEERMQALESVLEMPRPLLRFVRVPKMEEMPPGPLATTRLDPELLARGLVAAHLLVPKDPDEEEDDWRREEEEYPPTLSEKLQLLFEATHPEIGDLMTQPVWAAAELLKLGGHFGKYIASRDLGKQEGIIFRHLLRLILLCGEFQEVTPADTTPEEWRKWLVEVSTQLTESCRQVDPSSTDEIIAMAHAADVVEGETPKPALPVPPEPPKEEPKSTFGAGIFEPL